MTPRHYIGLLAVLLTMFSQSPAVAQNTGQTVNPEVRLESRARKIDRLSTPRTPPRIAAEEERLTPLFDLASELSRDRSWLTSHVVSKLHERALWLNEVFAGAPALLNVDGTYYRLVLEKDGQWKGFAESSPYLVYLAPEISNRMGKDRVEGFSDGSPSILSAEDVAALPAIGISLVELPASEAKQILAGSKSSGPLDGQSVVELGDPVSLGSVRSSVLDRPQPKPLMFANKAECPRQVAPSACFGGKPTCSTPGYSPYFVLDSLLVKEDHETFGSPEIDLYPTRLDITPASGSPQTNTGLIFDGRWVSDYAGQTVYLPDVNDKNQWYAIGGGLALFKSDGGFDFGATIVDDDKDAGKLILDGAQLNTTAVLAAAGGIRTIIKTQKTLDKLGWVSAIWGVYQSLKGVLVNNDDLYVESLGVSNSLFCESAVNEAFPHTVELNTTEWALRGHFACINPSCTPAPPPPPVCASTGEGCFAHDECCSAFCQGIDEGAIVGTCF
jgi:hypothetical protein